MGSLCFVLQILRTLLGLQNDASSFPCIYCTEKNSNFWVPFATSKGRRQYQKGMARTIANINEAAQTQSFGAKHKPILPIELEDIIIDSLHSFLVSDPQ